MGGLTSRNKGKRGEREIVNILQPVVDEVCAKNGFVQIELQRNTIQCDRGGYDIVGLDFLAIEVKHQEQLQPETWWKQTVKQTKKGQTPVLFYRKNRMDWRVRMPGVLFCATCKGAWHEATVDISIECFLGYLRKRLLQQFNKDLS